LMVGPNSYCKTWQTVTSCIGGDDVTDCDTCGGNAESTVSPSSNPVSPTEFPSPDAPIEPPEQTLPVSTEESALDPVSENESIPGIQPSNGCEDPPSGSTVPAFLWVEGIKMSSKQDAVSFFQRLYGFLESNCVNMGVNTLVVRTPNPVYPIKLSEAAFWPPANSPLFTELIAKIKSPIKILLYPYVMEDFDRTAWLNFGDKKGVWEGVFKFTKLWQDFVTDSGNKNVIVEGFMIDYEEIYKAIGTEHRVTLTPESLNPYRAAYPSVKTATSIGYDDLKTINFFYPFMDYLHLQVYDLYYPYEGSDESSKDSVFMRYKNDASGLFDVLVKFVFLPGIMKAYSGKESKIKLMWSTQTLADRDCLYPLNDGRCGINYEFNWKPRAFNEFLKLMIESPVLGKFEHGVYPYNFMRPGWLKPADRP
jgi:hypothetical protein